MSKSWVAPAPLVTWEPPPPPLVPAPIVFSYPSADGLLASWVYLWGERFAIQTWRTTQTSFDGFMTCELELRQVEPSRANPDSYFATKGVAELHLMGQIFSYGGMNWVVDDDEWFFRMGAPLTIEIRARFAGMALPVANPFLGVTP